MKRHTYTTGMPLLQQWRGEVELSATELALVRNSEGVISLGLGDHFS